MYGDNNNVKQDVETINEIIHRQGTKLLLHVISEFAGNTALKFSMDDRDKKNLKDGLLNELKESLLERL